MNNNSLLLREQIRFLEQKLESLNQSLCTSCRITSTQCHIITEIGRIKSCSLKELASLIGLDTSTTSRAVDALVKNNLLYRKTVEADRRSVALSLTKNGEQIFEQIEETMNDSFSQIFRLIPEEKRSALIDNLSDLNEALDAFKKE